jgi:hypothetical protein
MDLIERKSVKLLAHSTRVLGDMTAEALCDEPQKFLIARLLGELRALLDEFEDAYLEEGRPTTAAPR